MSKDGKSVFISDEYGPYVYQFDRADRQRIRASQLPANLDVSNSVAAGQLPRSVATPRGRVANKGMEGLAITPDGKTLVGIMQARCSRTRLSRRRKLLRIVTIDIATGSDPRIRLHADQRLRGQRIVALNDHDSWSTSATARDWATAPTRR